MNWTATRITLLRETLKKGIQKYGRISVGNIVPVGSGRGTACLRKIYVEDEEDIKYEVRPFIESDDELFRDAQTE